MEELPGYFDVIVIGTGMPECIIAAAAARVGKKVLHLDRNGYYGGDWASFSFDKFLEWIDETKASEETPAQNLDTLTSFLSEEERLVLCPLKSKSISNLTVKSYISDSPDLTVVSNSDCQPNVVVQDVSTESTTESCINEVSPASNSEESSSNIEGEGLPSTSSSQTSSAIPSSSSTSTENPVQSQQIQMMPQEWTISNFIESRRRFNIDLTPKLMFSRGSLVDLLISSNIARYAEFQCVNKVLTYINGHIEQVPCSRADVFSTKNVTVVEKRMLMKFLTFCVKFEEQEEEFRGFEDIPFFEFLRSKKLTPNVEHYIIHAIAMVDASCSTLQGLKATQKFLQSLGRYGKSPFLCTCYGSAELPQCFCRLCAVYEGMYYLKRCVEGVIVNDRCHGIVSMGQRINCQWLIMESSYAAPEFIPQDLPQKYVCLSRAILIADASLCPSERKENILLRIPSGPGITNPVTVLEFSSKTYVCPEDIYLVYMICRSTKSTAEEDLKPVVELLFKFDSSDSQSSAENNSQKPNLLWSLYYNQKDTSTFDINSCVPEGLFLTSSPDVELDYEHAVNEAREIFGKICPGEEFLPRAPDPEDILIERHNNPGDDADGEKIENDVNKSDSGFSGENETSSESASKEITNETKVEDSLATEKNNENPESEQQENTH